MHDFWEWMEKKKYGECEFIGDRTIYWLFHHQQHSNCTVSIKATNQMLIGYMMEYLREEEGMIILTVGCRAFIGDVYDAYVKDIKKIGGDHLLERMTGNKK